MSAPDVPRHWTAEAVVDRTLEVAGLPVSEPPRPQPGLAPLPLAIRDPIAARLAEIKAVNWATVNKAAAVLTRLREVVPDTKLIRRLAKFQAQQAQAQRRGHRAQRSRADKETTRMSEEHGRIIEETPEQTAAYEAQRQAAAANGHLTPEQRELAERRAARQHQDAARRLRWLESSGFAAVIEKAEALLADIPRAAEEHRRAQATLSELADFVALAAEVPEDRTLQRFARRAQDLAKTIAAEPPFFGNADALRDLIAHVRAADLDGANGPTRNGNVVTAWRRRFQELCSSLPQPGHAAWCRQQVRALLAEARAARDGR